MRQRGPGQSDNYLLSLSKKSKRGVAQGLHNSSAGEVGSEANRRKTEDASARFIFGSAH